MKPIIVALAEKPPQRYVIQIGPELLKNIVDCFPKDTVISTIVIITDHTVKKYYAATLQKIIHAYNYRSFVFSFPAGERFKTAATKASIEQKMLRKHCGRDTLILTLGGGVVGDLAGFIAATYMRGIPYIQIPTSLLAMIDSSVGGKTGINTAAGKNLIGAFWQPKAVIADLSVLRSLPQQQLQNGLFEALKIFLTCDKKSVYYFEKNLPALLSRDTKTLQTIIHRAVQLKTHIVEEDEYEKNKRMVLNFGHTIGHALEQLSNYKLLHGYAVGLGMLVEAKISQLLGLLTLKEFNYIQMLLIAVGINSSLLKKYTTAEIIHCTKQDKKNQQQQVNYVLLNAIGSVQNKNDRYAHATSDQLVQSALSLLQQR